MPPFEKCCHAQTDIKLVIEDVPQTEVISKLEGRGKSPAHTV